jgi:hypothetical protein
LYDSYLPPLAVPDTQLDETPTPANAQLSGDQSKGADALQQVRGAQWVGPSSTNKSDMCIRPDCHMCTQNGEAQMNISHDIVFLLSFLVDAWKQFEPCAMSQAPPAPANISSPFAVPAHRASGTQGARASVSSDTDNSVIINLFTPGSLAALDRHHETPRTAQSEPPVRGCVVAVLLYCRAPCWDFLKNDFKCSLFRHLSFCMSNGETVNARYRFCLQL